MVRIIRYGLAFSISFLLVIALSIHSFESHGLTFTKRVLNKSLNDEVLFQTIDLSTEELLTSKKDRKIKRVKEIIEERSANSKRYLLEDGTFEAVISTTEVHFKDLKGQWQDNNTKLTDEESEGQELIQVSSEAKKHKTNKKGFKANQLPFSSYFSKNFNEGFSITKNENMLSFIPIDSSIKSKATKSAKENAVLYKNAWNHVDAELEVLGNGVKETLILKNNKAPLTFSYYIIGDIDQSKLSNKEMTLDMPFLIDANGIYRDINQYIVKQNGSNILTFTIDPEGLTYPIVVDPTVTIQPYEIYSGITDKTIGNGGFTSRGRISYIGSNYKNSNQGNTYYRTLYKFDLTPFNNVNVLNAELILTRSSSLEEPVDPSRRIAIARIMDDWSFSAVNWSNQPDFWENYKLTLDPRSTFDSYVVTSDVSQMTNGGNNYGWILYQMDEMAYDGLDHRMSYIGSGYVKPMEAPKLVISYVGLHSKITIPNGTEFVNGITKIQWNQSVDPINPQNPIGHDIELLTLNGSWKRIGTNIIGSSLTYDFSGEEQGIAKLRIRVRNGFDYSNWVESISFTISPIQYIYNDLGQLKEVKLSPTKTLYYTYDKNGNLIAKKLNNPN